MQPSTLPQLVTLNPFTTTYAAAMTNPFVAGAKPLCAIITSSEPTPAPDLLTVTLSLAEYGLLTVTVFAVPVVNALMAPAMVVWLQPLSQTVTDAANAWEHNPDIIKMIIKNFFMGRLSTPPREAVSLVTFNASLEK